MTPVLAIIGTDTDVGKTFIAAQLLAFLQRQSMLPGYVKLVSCGGAEAADWLFCQEVAGLAATQGRVIYHFPLAASPHLAAREAGQEIDPVLLAQGIAQAQQEAAVVIVEGVGGLLVPLRQDLLLADFLAAQRLPLLLVARSGLGTLNHTLLTIKAARLYGLTIGGIIFSDEQEYSLDDGLVADNIRTIGELSGATIIGRMPWCHGQEEARHFFQPLAEEIISRFALAGGRESTGCSGH